MRPIAVTGACLLFCLAANAATPPMPTFFARRDYAMYNRSVAAADVNGDGIPDLIVAGSDTVLLGNGDGTFRQGPSTPSGMSLPTTLIAEDINGDGKVDLILAGVISDSGPSSGIGVCLGNGDGTFQPMTLYQAGTDTGIGSVALGDFNGDGIQDVATAGSSGVWLFTGKGDGTFNPGVLAVSLSSDAGGIAAADFNGDNKLDLVVTMPFGPIPPGSGAGFAVLLGNGDGTFQPPEIFAEPRKAPAVTVGDLNGDGHPDIVVRSGLSEYAYIYLGNGVGGFAGPTYTYLPGVGNIAIGDVNGDGIPDLVNPGVSIALGRGNGTFTKPISYAVQAVDGAYNVVLADLRNNGLTDIVTDSVNAVSVLSSEGKGRYEDGLWVPVSGGRPARCRRITMAMASPTWRSTPHKAFPSCWEPAKPHRRSLPARA